VKALLLDFNGTLSDDEPLLCQIFMELFAEVGKPLTAKQYYAELAGLSDPEVVAKWLGEPRSDLVERKIERYRELADGSTIDSEARAAVVLAAEHLQVAVVSGSAKAEIEPVLAAAGLTEAVTVLVASDDIRRSKPDPEGYLIALHLLGIDPSDAFAVEDSDVGVAAAKRAGVYCVAVTTTLPAERLSEADELADRFDRELITRLVSPA
jgi:beta-phosphoglucomutase